MLPDPPPGDLPDPGIKLMDLVAPVLAGRFFTTSDTWEEKKKEEKLHPFPSFTALSVSESCSKKEKRKKAAVGGKI